MRYIIIVAPPWWNSPCRCEGAFPLRSFNQIFSKRRAQLSITAKVVRSTDLLNHSVNTWVNTNKTRLQRPSLSTPQGVVWFHLHLSLCCNRTAPEVSEEEGGNASRFYRWFLESLKSCLLLLVALPGLIDTLAELLAWSSLLWLSMTRRRRYLTQNQHNIAGLISRITFIVLSSQEKPLRWKKINTHIHTQTHTRIIVANLWLQMSVGIE